MTEVGIGCTNGRPPEEFVAAGDFLTFKFPVWQWRVAAGLRTMLGPEI